jgi:hypothetical protein
MRIAQQKLLQLTRLQQLTALTLHANQMTDCPVALAVTTEVGQLIPVCPFGHLSHWWDASRKCQQLQEHMVCRHYEVTACLQFHSTNQGHGDHHAQHVLYYSVCAGQPLLLKAGLSAQCMSWLLTASHACCT